MSAPAREKTADGSASARDSGSSSKSARGGSELLTEHGKTSISDTVVSKIVGIAAREVPGVHSMGAGFSRAVGAVRERLSGAGGGGGGGPNYAQGVAVEVGERQAAVDLDVVAEYGVSIPDLAAGVRRNVSGAVEKMCGLEVTEVNIAVGDIHLPGDSDDDSGESRVQ